MGLEAARQLAGRGMHVVLTARAEDSIAKALGELRKPENVEGRVLDVSDQASVDSFFDWLKEMHGRIDVLINNAGRAGPNPGDPLRNSTTRTRKTSSR